MSNDRIVLSDDKMMSFINEYENIIYKIAYMHLKDKNQTEDVFQEVFLKAFCKYRNFDDKNKEKAWLLRITKNVCIDYKRAAWFRYVNLNLDFDDLEEKGVHLSSNEQVETNYIIKEEKNFIYKKVMSLPRKFKEIILLYYYNELDTPQISRLIGTSESNVRNRLCRARKKLEKELVRSGMIYG